MTAESSVLKDSLNIGAGRPGSAHYLYCKATYIMVFCQSISNKLV